MSLTARTTLDFANLSAPKEHGEVLVMPDPAGCVRMARNNANMLRAMDRPLAGSTLAAWRRRTREVMVGGDDQLIIVIGHQPGFIHAGVWAKHIVALRLARALDGVAVNLVVDSDTLRQTTLAVPSSQAGDLTLRPVSVVPPPPPHLFEQIAWLSPEAVQEFGTSVRSAMGDRYDSSQMPAFVAAMAEVTSDRDWVDQLISGRRAIEAGFDMRLEDRRVSRTWWTPLLVDWLEHAARFAAAYNRALAWYRRANRVRGLRRPIPDLAVNALDVELPVWVHRAGGGNHSRDRRRLFVRLRGNSLTLLADGEEFDVVTKCTLQEWLEDETGGVELHGWCFRPRALALTIWARLLLADLFVHGIGGAKYDRISDAIIADYYGLTPPAMACVSATLHLDLPHRPVTAESIRRMKHEARDLKWNPQRHFLADKDLDSLREQRSAAVREASVLRTAVLRTAGPRTAGKRALKSHDRRTRRALFERIREINAALVAARAGVVAEQQATIARALEDHRISRIATDRDYFFGLFDRQSLEGLLTALPATADFRI